MASDDVFSSIGSFLGGLFGGSKAKKATAANLAALNKAVDVLSQENVKQSKTILYLGIGLGVVLLVIVLIVVLKKRRK
jgi:uncharacterized membrane protein required for colicin V production